MLFPYKYINHDMEKMQKYMDYIFFEVWVKAKNLGDFDESLFDKNIELQNIIKAFNFLPDSPKWGKYFLEHVKNIFEIFKTLNDVQIKELKYWYKANNNINKLCNGKLKPIVYKDLKVFNKDLSDELSKLYSKLYDKKIIGLKDIKDNIGSSIDEHYHAFMTTNNKGVCPFCGLHIMKGIHHTKREAYDHYFPKGKYPFNSINFKNLAPMCHECNSSYKLENNPIYDKNTNRRKAFNPFRVSSIAIKIDITLRADDKTDIKPENIDMTISSSNDEETNTWEKIFGIYERYKAVCSSNSDAIEWITLILDDCKEAGISTNVYFDLLNSGYKREPFYEKRFLKIPFLKACKEKGII